MKRVLTVTLILATFRAHGFCGFYVAKADATLYNKASQVILVRNENKTAITMFSDYKGEMSEFALVVPVPEVLKKEQINVGEKSLVEKVDAYSAPRLVEYFDADPCQVRIMMERNMAPMSGMGKMEDGGSKSYGVTVEAQYTIGEYDIVILSANESRGLESWLKDKGYKIPGSAHKALEPYLKQKMKFFVAKVNIKEQSKTGFSYLRPIQFAFESPKFMLPIRLGMVNSDGPQDLLIYAITKKGRVETVEHYRTVKLPTGMDIPAYIKKKGKFADFYRDTFKTAHEKENKRAVMLEYAWNMGWCDPCAADPLTKEELRKIGVWWLEDSPASGIRPQIWPPPQQGVQAYITRLHVRYDAENFPEDLFFQETADIENFQGRYIIRHPWEGEAKCDAATQYKNALKERRQTEARVLASLTGWPLAEIQNQMGERISMEPSNSEKKWYETIFR